MKLQHFKDLWNLSKFSTLGHKIYFNSKRNNWYLNPWYRWKEETISFPTICYLRTFWDIWPVKVIFWDLDLWPIFSEIHHLEFSWILGRSCLVMYVKSMWSLVFENWVFLIKKQEIVFCVFFATSVLITFHINTMVGIQIYSWMMA